MAVIIAPDFSSFNVIDLFILKYLRFSCCSINPALNMFSENIIMMSNFLSYIKEIKVNKFLYISSDAVYSDSKNLLTETSETNPTSLHGIMHLVREQMIKNVFVDNYLILRPTLIYGFSDPHNGYGPNLFVRKSKTEKQINLFGNGEELRDHIDVRLVSELIQKIVFNERNGVFNLVSGNLISFREIANIIKDIFWKKKIEVNIFSIPRNGPMPHGGYRGFDNSKLRPYIVDKNLLDLKKNINYYIQQLD